LVPLAATATKRPFPYVTEVQKFASAAERAVHVVPSGLVITRLVPLAATATKRPFPYVTENQPFASAAERAVQLLDIVHALSDVPVGSGIVDVGDSGVVDVGGSGVITCSPRANNISGPKSITSSPYNVIDIPLPQEKYVNPNNIIIKDVVIFFIIINRISVPHKFMILNFITSKKIESLVYILY
jgi:hypothetical protein